MAKRRKSTRQNTEGGPTRRRDAPGENPAPASTEGHGGKRGKLRAWFQANRGDLRFLLVFGACMAVYYLATLTSPVKDGFFPVYLRINAQASGALLRAFGEDVKVLGQSMTAPNGSSIQIERGCDAVEPSALFVAAVLASPVPLLSRLSAALVGTLLLMAINLIRVASLFWVRVYYPSAFETMHLDVWQALFIFLAIVLWAIWASRMSRTHRERMHAPA